ncbi:MAG TPA: hypothetical protein VMZ50_09460, partial [Phycisphaerae bacterium]|nr:hypothetical protein [Phycisphaerae bacterium]
MGDETIRAHDRLVTEAQERAQQAADGDGHAWVVRTVARLAAGAGAGWEHNGELGKVEDAVIRVGTFKTTPARVSVTKGLVVNLGNYETARVTVGYECPCYLEEVEEVDAAINAIVERRIQAEVVEITGKDIR